MGSEKGTIDPAVYRAILASMGDGIVFLDTEDCFAYINAAAEKIRGIRAENYLGRHILSIFGTHSNHTSERVRKLLAALRSGVLPFHVHIIETRGRVFENSYYPIRDKGGNYLGTLMMSRDITEKERLKAENLTLREQVLSEFGCCDLVGSSDVMRPIFQIINAAAAVDSTILITGESGTGKELVARAVHQHSARKDLPMIKVNCAALPDTLLESELFGHEKGAFTGAIKERKGKFEQAHGGTIFLDEIAEMPLAAQAKLLRVLQERTVERLGSTREIRVDVRIIAATNRDLRREVTAGRFREDLFYRLNVIPIHIPPLRERTEDILALARQFLNRFAEKMHKPVMEIAPEAQKALLEYNYPGNVRELENAVERAVALSLGSNLRLGDLPSEFTAPHPAGAQPLSPSAGPASLADSVHSMEKNAIEEALRSTGNKKGDAARLLGISRKTLWEKMKQLGVT
ncbi:PAS modulated sigma54 specific transcriptional regulator, Fis family [Geobacter metallireducens RCH3]|uniref:Sigma-54-dependent sensor transcriptional regulator, PAS domain-containing n=1 Tax=Geobacter metallireducens (strain ATCC 53774 / DSM 7210 / GS-15) TaxID=269799 RepID=Q39YU2_GEOMG|nr:sigma-54-dependent Fis family transcriptional regulator [Geobacter metallireducens]ABB30582.1 sigma-54-dependent sensor transcriptional regulator, PAS domain-containing [Geobacter metallireducens GS-15]EHP87969.1 PAS modulated sigma54 specific transcriptional regulator, Fis family [Geobacter metallireducens RCH3]